MGGTRANAAGGIRRLDLGWFVRPGTETGDGAPRVEPALGYLVDHGGELLLFDTGIGAADPGAGPSADPDDDPDVRYRPYRRPLLEALAAAGAAPSGIALVVNCHLHFDHVGGNPLFPGTPILAQAAEMDLVRGGGHTPERLVDFPGARYEELAGEAEVRPGVWVVPTPGHTAGHQSLVVCRADGTVVLAGQTHASASDFAAARLADTVRTEGARPPLPEPDDWPRRLLAFAPRRVLFAHDASVWEPIA